MKRVYVLTSNGITTYYKNLFELHKDYRSQDWYDSMDISEEEYDNMEFEDDE